MTQLLVAVIAVLGVTRATQIALHDRIFQGPRDWLTGKVNPNNLPAGHPDLGYFGYLLQCPWCVSVWIGLTVSALVAWDTTRRPTVWVLAGLGLSLLAVVTDRLIDTYASDEDAARRQTVIEGDVNITAEDAPVVVHNAFVETEANRRTIDWPTGDDHTEDG